MSLTQLWHSLLTGHLWFPEQQKIVRKLPFDRSYAGQTRIDGAGIVPWVKRLGVGLASVWQQRMLLTGAWERTLMTDHFIPPLLCPPECADVFFFLCGGAPVFVPSTSTPLFKCSLPAHYGNRKGSSRCSRANEWCDGTLSVYYYKPENNIKGQCDGLKKNRID